MLYLVILFTVAHAVMTVWGITLLRHRFTIPTLLLVLPIALLVYDNGMVALGAWLDAGPTLHALSIPRYIGHAFFTPVWIVTAAAVARRGGALWLIRRWAMPAAWLLYGMMVLFGVFDSLMLSRLEPETIAGMTQYRNVAGIPGPPAPAIIMVLVKIYAGIVLVLKQRWPWLLAGGGVMFIAAAIPASVAGPALSAAGEVILAVAFLATETTLQRTVDPGCQPSAIVSSAAR